MMKFASIKRFKASLFCQSDDEIFKQAFTKDIKDLKAYFNQE